MAFSIDTFGPFPLSNDKGSFNGEEFWQQVSVVKENLPETYGLYLFVVREKGSSKYFPCYIGKTKTSFRRRLRSHFKSWKNLGKINDKFPRQETAVFLIAVLTPGGGTAKHSSSRLRWVDFIETSLIATCMAINPDLINEKKTLLNKRVCVPGFLGDQVADRNQSAKALANMLKPARSN